MFDGRTVPARSRIAGPRAARPSAWRLWQLPRPGLLFLLAVDTTATTALAIEIAGGDLGPGLAWIRCAALVVLGMTAAECGRRAERVRRRYAAGVHVNMSSVWTLAGAIVLPPALSLTVVAVLYAHLWLRSQRPQPYRAVFSAANTALCCVATGFVARATGLVGATGWWQPAGAVLAIATYVAINSLLSATAMVMLRAGGSLSCAVGGRRENALELATLCMGALTAIALVSNAFVLVLVLPPIFVPHRAVLLRELERAASTDQKTGLLNAATWHNQAEQEIRANDNATLLMLDLDHFKRLNDRYGHVAADEVLRAVAGEISRGVRADIDLCGRYGGEEFVVLLPDTGYREGIEVAERLCRVIRDLRVQIPAGAVLGDRGPEPLATTTSIGVATFPDHGDDLLHVLAAADHALLTAKADGRDRVVPITHVLT
ncbi:GGDEF domain-containing protein [Actinokineospora enzanensis]|uniref:GGDEF domain-containing protein n=1 Tax=Actinokineospora enzanensis TaxID=155975 RepID=UPI000477D68D|nr:diguanylate cyclase [Actinokineospora enzanensis]